MLFVYARARARGYDESVYFIQFNSMNSYSNAFIFHFAVCSFFNNKCCPFVHYVRCSLDEAKTAHTHTHTKYSLC